MASASDLQRGDFFLMNGAILQVTRREVVAVGTHSHTKLKFYAKSIKGGGEKQFTFSHGDKVEKLDIQKKHATVIAKTPGGVQIMDPVSFETFDAAVDESLGELSEGDDIIYFSYNNEIKILEKRRE